MCSGALLPKILMFSIPLLLSGILQLLFNAADIVVVGRFAGKEGFCPFWAALTITIYTSIPPLSPGSKPFMYYIKKEPGPFGPGSIEQSYVLEKSYLFSLLLWARRLFLTRTSA